MKLITFFIILITLLNYSNQALIDVDIDYDPVAKYGTKDFNTHYGLLMFLDVSEFQKDENIYYYFEFDKDDALDEEYSYYNNKKKTTYESLIGFYEAETNEIVQNNDIYSVYFGPSYEKTPKSTESGSSKAKFYFSSKKKILNI
jgi:hypothetical protein